MSRSNIRASIAMAVYNGEKYLRPQMDSIIAMMGMNDELVVSYDRSSDRTYEILMEYRRKDNRVRVYRNDQSAGVCGNFNNAVAHCHGRFIFIADQDDVWIGDKIDGMISALEESGRAMAVHNGYITDSSLHVKGKLFQRVSVSPVRALVKNTGDVLGCCMAVRREYLGLVYPFYDDDYDRWMMFACCVHGGVRVVNQPYIYHRVHGGNVTPVKRRMLYVVFIDRMKKILWLAARSIRFRRAAKRM